MAEYLVKFHIRAKGLFGPSCEDSEVVEADTAKEATEKLRQTIETKLGVDADEVVYSILDVHKV